MKKHHWIVVVSIPFIFYSCQRRIDPKEEGKAIKSVIEGEIKASFYGDYESWTDFFAHKPYTIYHFIDKGICNCWEGWENISAAAGTFIRPERTSGKMYEGYYDYAVKIYEEAALVTFKTKTTVIRRGDEFDLVLIGSEVRFLEKQDGEWKITYLGSYIQ